MVYLGKIVIGIKGLARKQLGTKTLIVILDNKWKRDVIKAVIAQIEVDKNKNKGIFLLCTKFSIKYKRFRIFRDRYTNERI